MNGKCVGVDLKVVVLYIYCFYPYRIGCYLSDVSVTDDAESKILSNCLRINVLKIEK